jgi:hypothetical protein
VLRLQYIAAFCNAIKCASSERTKNDIIVQQVHWEAFEHLDNIVGSLVLCPRKISS